MASRRCRLTGNERRGADRPIGWIASQSCRSQALGRRDSDLEAIAIRSHLARTLQSSPPRGRVACFPRVRRSSQVHWHVLPAAAALMQRRSDQPLRYFKTVGASTILAPTCDAASGSSGAAGAALRLRRRRAISTVIRPVPDSPWRDSHRATACSRPGGRSRN